jgi:hypothetical protein
MQRSKSSETGAGPGSGPGPKPGGSWLAGIVIGSTIMSMATSAAVLGASLALRDFGLKRG